MSDWKIFPNGELINLDMVEYISIVGDRIFFKTGNNTYISEKDPKMIEVVKKLSLNIKAGDNND